MARSYPDTSCRGVGAGHAGDELADWGYWIFSFPCSAWQCIPDAPRHHAGRRASPPVPTQSVGSRGVLRFLPLVERTAVGHRCAQPKTTQPTAIAMKSRLVVNGCIVNPNDVRQWQVCCWAFLVPHAKRRSAGRSIFGAFLLLRHFHGALIDIFAPIMHAVRQ